MGQPEVKIRLSSPYEITAQSSGDDARVLRLVIRSGDRVIFQDEASGFGVITASGD